MADAIGPKEAAGRAWGLELPTDHCMLNLAAIDYTVPYGVGWRFPYAQVSPRVTVGFDDTSCPFALTQYPHHHLLRAP